MCLSGRRRETSGVDNGGKYFILKPKEGEKEINVNGEEGEDFTAPCGVMG